jgi:hypothetical protein
LPEQRGQFLAFLSGVKKLRPHSSQSFRKVIPPGINAPVVMNLLTSIPDWRKYFNQKGRWFSSLTINGAAGSIDCADRDLSGTGFGLPIIFLLIYRFPLIFGGKEGIMIAISNLRSIIMSSYLSDPMLKKLEQITLIRKYDENEFIY